MNNYPENIEIVRARREHTSRIKSTMKDFYSDEPVFKAQKINIKKLNNDFYLPRKTDYTLVAIDKDNNDAVASLAINSITKPRNVMRQRKFAG